MSRLRKLDYTVKATLTLKDETKYTALIEPTFNTSALTILYEMLNSKKGPIVFAEKIIDVEDVVSCDFTLREGVVELISGYDV